MKYKNSWTSYAKHVGHLHTLLNHLALQCDYAVGLSRMMNGRVVASERTGHTILEG